MGTMPWLRLYTEIMDDPKLRNFTGDQFRDWIYLLCLAREAREPGVIEMSIEDAAWRLRRPPEEFKASLMLFADPARNMVRIEDGRIIVLHFVDRQYDKPSDRPEATRDRKRRSRASHANVTRSHAVDTDTDTDTEAEVVVPPKPPKGEEQPPPLEEGQDAPDPMKPVIKFLFENFIPTATQYQAERLAAWVEQDGMEPDLLIWAMEEALLNGQRKISYVESILDRCKREGIKTRAAAELDKQTKVRGRDSPEQTERIVADPTELARIHEELQELLGKEVAHGGA